MFKFIKVFDKHSEYLAKRGNFDLPNVSFCIDDKGVHYNPYVPPMNVITYEATEKLTETTNSSTSGLHTNAFKDTNGQQLTMTSHTFENGVGTIEFDGDIASIGSWAFYHCGSLTSVTIPDSVTIIDDYAFSGCTNLTSVTIGSGVTSIGRSAFESCTGLTSIDIPNSVKIIGVAAFYKCSGLTSVTIGNSVTIICNVAFDNCTSLTSVTIPNNVKNIGQAAFSGCSSLTSITIPNSVTSIDDYVFSGCTNLTSVTSLATTAPTIQSNTFQDVKTNGTLTVPSGSSGYDVWMGTGDYYLGKYGWTKVEQ